MRREPVPGVIWREKPGATVLARHAHPGMTVDVGGRQEQEVLMATQLVGPGRVMWIGFDSTYRWRFAGEKVSIVPGWLRRGDDEVEFDPIAQLDIYNEARVYGVALNATQIQQLAAAGPLVGAASPPAGGG